MDHKEFKTLLEELDGNSLKTLTEKNARYSSNGDALHNFHSGGDIFGGTPAQACWGYLTKHLVALRDMVEINDFSNREDFLEKCQDSINYIRFLWCIGNEWIKENRSDAEYSYQCKLCGEVFSDSDLEMLYSDLIGHMYDEHSLMIGDAFPIDDAIDIFYAKEN